MEEAEADAPRPPCPGIELHTLSPFRTGSTVGRGRPGRGSRSRRRAALTSLTLNTSVVCASPAARSRQTKTVKRRLTNNDHDRMVELYEGGDDAQSVAQQVGVAKSTVLRTLKARGV